MSPFPKTQEAWIETLGRSLFIGCVVVGILVVLGTLFGGIYWRYAREPVGYRLLPALGVLLAASCIPRKGRPTAFRLLAGAVAIGAIAYGIIAPILEPAY